jgi:multidrug resistance efflux pump
VEGPVTAPPTSADQQSTNGAAAATPPARKLKRSTRIGLIVILILALIAGSGFAVSYFLNARNYVSTDNAQIDGQQILITAPATGNLLNWSATDGTVVNPNQIVGRVEIQDGFAQPQMPIHAPGAGTIAVDNTVPGEYVTAGTQLAVAYNLNDIYVTARVDETDINSVHLGQVVDISVDAYPHTPLTGRVREVNAGSAAVFSLFPQNNNSSGGNFQKVTEVIPVKIGIDNVDNLDLVPGMNVTVHIHKH